MAVVRDPPARFHFLFLSLVDRWNLQFGMHRGENGNSTRFLSFSPPPFLRMHLSPTKSSSQRGQFLSSTLSSICTTSFLSLSLIQLGPNPLARISESYRLGKHLSQIAREYRTAYWIPQQISPVSKTLLWCYLQSTSSITIPSSHPSKSIRLCKYSSAWSESEWKRVRLCFKCERIVQTG